MPAVSQTHLSVYCFPLLGMRERLLHLSASDLVKPVRGCSRETQTARTVNGGLSDFFKKTKRTAHRAKAVTSGRLDACVFKGFTALHPETARIVMTLGLILCLEAVNH